MYPKKLSLAFLFLICPFVSLADDQVFALRSCFPPSPLNGPVTNASWAGIMERFEKKEGFNAVMNDGVRWYWSSTDKKQGGTLYCELDLTVSDTFQYDERGVIRRAGPTYDLTLGESGIVRQLQELRNDCEGAGWDRGGLTEFQVAEGGSGAHVRLRLWGKDDKEVQQGDTPAPFTFNATALPSTPTTTEVSEELPATAKRRSIRTQQRTSF